MTTYGLMLPVNNVKSDWWSLLPLTNLTNSSSLQNGRTQIAQLFLILEGDKNLTRSNKVFYAGMVVGRGGILIFTVNSSRLNFVNSIYLQCDYNYEIEISVRTLSEKV